MNHCARRTTDRPVSPYGFGFRLAASLVFTLLGSAPLSAAPWVVISEIHYAPYEGRALEFVELCSKEPPRADLSNWTLRGEVEFTFPAGTILAAGERLVVAAAPDRLRESYPKAKRVYGPFRGKLDNAGGRLTLRNAAGAKVCEVRYGSDGRWTSIPYGSGHSLSLEDIHLDPANPRNWRPSPRVGGTPAAENGFSSRVDSVPIVKLGAIWKYRKGTEAPPARWRQLDFDDRGWQSGPGGIGYGDDDDATIIDDMRGSYYSLYVRHEFTVTDPSSFKRVVLRCNYDDGFIGYLNGKEVARAQMGAVGSEVAFDAPSAEKHEAGVAAEFDLGNAATLLRPGKNVLAFQVHNDDLDSSDLSIAVELESRDPSERRGWSRTVVVNECVAGADASKNFIELFNPNATAASIGGHYLSDLRQGLYAYRIPLRTTIPPHGMWSVRAEKLGNALDLTSKPEAITLTAPDGRRVVDLVRLNAAKPKNKNDDATMQFGRYPDGGEAAQLRSPSPGKRNVVQVRDAVVIHEIMYHPLSDESDDEFLELRNTSDEPQPLDGWRLATGVRFTFPDGATIAPGGYVVVAKNPSKLASKYKLPEEGVYGPFKGKLSDSGETIDLLDPDGNIADTVTYADRSPWPTEADGRGSSLELVHPSLDNEIAASWRASDERAKAKWKSFSYSKDHKTFEDKNIPELQLMLLGAGACLIDDLHLRSGKEFVADGSFERGGSGWKALGTHEGSGLYEEDAARGKMSYRLLADGRGDPRHNYVTLAVPGGLTPGRRYRISFRARWQSGSQYLLTRTAGQGVARTHQLDIPKTLGSPGAENSRHVDNATPAVGMPEQFPTTPTPDESVQVRVRLSAVDGIQEALLRYRRNGELAWRDAPLKPAASTTRGTTYIGELPPQAPGIIEYFVRAIDTQGRVGHYPRTAPELTAMYGVGLIPNGSFPSYTLLVSDREWRALQDRPRLSNKLADATLVYGDSRVLYNVGFRRRGSPWTRAKFNWRIVFGAENLDGRGTLTVDGQGGDGTRLNERLTYWLAEQVRAPNVRQQYVYFRLFGHDEEGIYEDVEKIDGDFLSSWFESPAKESLKVAPIRKKRSPRRSSRNPIFRSLHKVDDYFELYPDGKRGYRESFLDFKSSDVEDYRWNFPPRANGNRDDLEPLVELIHFMDPDTTPNATFARHLEDRLDGALWMRVLAARTFSNDWDTLGRERGKNAFLYRSPVDGRWRLLPWDCDLSWGRSPTSSLTSKKFASFNRLLSVPLYRRWFFGSLLYLAQRTEPARFGRVLDDLSSKTGAATAGFKTFAITRRDKILREVQDLPLRVNRARRKKRKDAPDLVEIAGVAPLTVTDFRLDGRRGSVEFVGYEGFVASFEIGPEKGEAELSALDFGGRVARTAAVQYSGNKSAQPLPEPPIVEALNLERRWEAPPKAAPAEAPSFDGSDATSIAEVSAASPESTASADSGATDARTMGSAHDRGRGDLARRNPEGGDLESGDLGSGAPERGG